jgi:hypothetical protein
MLQTLFNSLKEWRSYGMFGVKRVQCLVMGKFLKIKISNLKSLIIASLSLEHKEVL